MALQDVLIRATYPASADLNERSLGWDSGPGHLTHKGVRARAVEGGHADLGRLPRSHFIILKLFAPSRATPAMAYVEDNDLTGARTHRVVDRVRGCGDKENADLAEAARATQTREIDKKLNRVLDATPYPEAAEGLCWAMYD